MKFKSKEKEKQDKHLLAMWRKYRKLSDALSNTPLVPLDKPYRRGWIKGFRLRDDVARRKDAHVFRLILRVIGTSIFCRNKDFTSVKDKKKVPLPMRLKFIVDPGKGPVRKTYAGSPYLYGWPEELPEHLKKHFVHGNIFHEKHVYIGWDFRLPWMFATQIRPNYVTHVRGHRPDIESQMAEINAYFCGNHLFPRLTHLQAGSTRYNRGYSDKERRKQLEAKAPHIEEVDTPDGELVEVPI